jgi:hypothetical protein
MLCRFFLALLAIWFLLFLCGVARRRVPFNTGMG